MNRLRLAVFLCSFPVLVSAASTYSVTIQVTEDGQDNLILTGDTLEWEHIGSGLGNSLSNFANAGVTGGTVSETNFLGNSQSVHNPYMLVSGTDSADAGLDFTDSDWYNGIQGFNCPGGSGSNHLTTCPYYDTGYEYMLPFSLGNATSITLSNVTEPGLGLVIVTQEPSAGNGFTAIVNFNDDAVAGANVYDVTLNFTNTPEPATAALGGLGLIALGLLGRKRKA